LNLLNGGFLLQQSENFSLRLQAEAKEDRSAQIRRAFQIAYLREPAPTETAAAIELIKAHGLTAFCRAILNSNELIYLN
jgi:hypothetical protein